MAKNMQENSKNVKINFEVENYKILEFICTSKEISKHEYINKLLEKEFQKINKNKFCDMMAELEKL